MTAAELDHRLRLLDPLIYADVFDCAATIDELWRYGRARIEREALQESLHHDPVLRRVVIERGGMCAFRDRPGLIEQRPRSIDRARRLQRRARRVARLLRHAPFVRGLALTGSAAAEDAAAGDDVDVFVIVSKGRLGVAFLLLASASRLTRRRFFCPNYYVSEGRCAIEPGNLYVARELAQARSLVGDEGVLRAANPWLETVFPNALTPATASGPLLRTGGWLQRLLELPLRGRLGERAERFGQRVAFARLAAHHGALGREVPADVSASLVAGASLRFHGRGADRTTLDRYVARRDEIAALLARLDEDPEPARVTGDGSA
jgi:hypothetical protein